VMAYQMLSGQVPFEGESAVAILTKHIMEPPPPLDVIRPGLPKQVYPAIDRALAKKPDQRFPSVGAFARALKEGGEPITTPTPKRRSAWAGATTTPVTVSPGRRWLRVLSLAALAGGGVGTGALILINQQRSAAPAIEGTARSDSAASALAVQQPPETVQQPAAGLGAQGSSTSPQPAEAQPARPPAPQPTTGRIRITGLPAGGTVVIDGQRRSGTSFELSSGAHTVRLSAPGFEPGSDTTITLRAGDSVRLPFSATPIVRAAPPPPASAEQQRPQVAQPAAPSGGPPQPAPVQAGILVVRTVGGWARIFVDGALRREGTSHRDSLPPGTHTLRLEREGYVTVDTTVTVRAGETRVVTINMRTGGS